MNILRELTDDEKRDEIMPLKPDTMLKRFLVRLAERQTKASKLYKPFDSYGARIDFENYLKARASDIVSTVDPEKVNDKLDFDLEPYAEMSRFEYKGRKDYKLPSKIMGVTQEILAGKSYKFVTKLRGNKCGIVVPLADIEKYEVWLSKVFPEDFKKVESDVATVESEDSFKKEVSKVESKEETKSSKK